MVYFSMDDYTLRTIRKSARKHKKYDAVLERQGKETIIPFGDSRYEQYKDSTKIKAFKHKDHNDMKRRKAYIARHSHFIRKGYYSAGYFSMKYLWAGYI